MYICHIITMHALNLHNAICQLYLDKTGGEKNNKKRKKTLLPRCVEETEKDKGNGDPKSVRQKLWGLDNDGPYETLGLRDTELETGVSILCNTRTTVCLGSPSSLGAVSGPASNDLKRQGSQFKILERRARVHVSCSLGKFGGGGLKFSWGGG